MFAPRLRPGLFCLEHALHQGLKRFGQLFHTTFEDASRQEVGTSGVIVHGGQPALPYTAQKTGRQQTFGAQGIGCKRCMS